jgi:hypothetical protein
LTQEMAVADTGEKVRRLRKERKKLCAKRDELGRDFTDYDMGIYSRLDNDDDESENKDENENENEEREDRKDNTPEINQPHAAKDTQKKFVQPWKPRPVLFIANKGKRNSASGKGKERLRKAVSKLGLSTRACYIFVHSRVNR